MPKLTKRLVEGLKPVPGRDACTWDSELRGFGVRVRPTGTASYLVQYRTKTGIQRKFTLGSVNVLTVEEARKRARELLVQVEDGKDPAQERRELRGAMTLNEAWDTFDREYLSLSNKTKPITRDSYNALYDRYVRDDLGQRPLESVTFDDMERLHGKLHQTPYSANRTIAALSKFFNWRFKKKHNPTRGIERYKEFGRQRDFTPDELASLGTALMEFAQRPDRLPSLAPFFLLTAFCGTRKGEWLMARWENVDFHRQLLVLQDSKTGPKIVEIPPPAMQVLEALRDRARHLLRFRTDLYVLPGRIKDKPLNNPYKAWGEILKAAGLKGVRIHDLRHLFGSLSHRIGANQRTVAMLLGHQQLSTTERYIHGYNEDRKSAAEKTAQALLSALTPKSAQVLTYPTNGASNGAGSQQSPETSSARQAVRPRQRKLRGR